MHRGAVVFAPLALLLASGLLSDHWPQACASRAFLEKYQLGAKKGIAFKFEPV
jgi:hypothetical protein